ncbi:hypothetical protein LTR94_023784 [Friedmanniomyces endolithicus]|nr:hypothetical protein LTR94_023784 [Friedmanniomyces endolithicus]
MARTSSRQSNRATVIGSVALLPMEDDGAIGRSTGGDDTPPVRKQRQGGGQMALVRDEGRPVDDLSIGRHLPGQTLETVGLSLDLDAPDMAVDDRDIDA